jgi:hypothetical protein
LLEFKVFSRTALNKVIAAMDRKSKESRIPDAMEGAFLAVLAQNAYLISKPLADLGKGANFQIVHGMIIIISIINFFNIAANWISTRQIFRSEVKYSRTHLFWDVLTLALFAVLTQTLIDINSDCFTSNISFILSVTGVCYLLMNFLFFVWNRIEIQNQKRVNSKDAIESVNLLKKANIRNLVSAFFATAMIMVTIIFDNDSAYTVVFAFWLLNWVLVIYYYVSQNRLMSEII